MTQEYPVSGGTVAVDLGMQGEHKITEVVFVLTDWVKRYGTGGASLFVRRSGENQPYPVAVEQSGDRVTWTVQEADTAKAGVGELQLHYTVEGRRKKSRTYKTYVRPSLEAPGTGPQPVQAWLNAISDQERRVKQWAQQTQDHATAARADADRAAEEVRLHGISDNTVSSEHSWSSAALVERFCPNIAEEGSFITCRPLPNSQLSVTLRPQQTGTFQFVHCGTNFLCLPQGEHTDHGIRFRILNGGVVAVTGTVQAGGARLRIPLDLPILSDFSLSGCPITGTTQGHFMELEVRTGRGQEFLRDTGSGCYRAGMAQPQSLILTIPKGRNVELYFTPQLESGHRCTPFSPYEGETVPMHFSDTSPLALPKRPVYAGTNHLYCNGAMMTVHGQKHPAAELDELVRRVELLEQSALRTL